MKKIHFLILILLYALNLFRLSANEKVIIPVSLENQNNQSVFSFASYNKNNESNENKFYQKKANGFLAMGISGAILSPIALSAGAYLGYIILLFQGLWFYNYNFGELMLNSVSENFFGQILLALVFGIAFLAPFLIMAIIGLNYYKKYKNSKMPDPFLRADKNKNFDLGLSFKIK